eukprot:529781-Rhodomonas_salina.2
MIPGYRVPGYPGTGDGGASTHGYPGTGYTCTRGSLELEGQPGRFGRVQSQRYPGTLGTRYPGTRVPEIRI